MAKRQLQLTSSWLLWRVFADLWGKCLNLIRKNLKYIFLLFDILVNVCETYSEPDGGPKAPDNLSSFALPSRRKTLLFLGRILSQNDQKESKNQNFPEVRFLLEIS